MIETDDTSEVTTGLRHVTERDPDMAAALKQVGTPPPRRRPPGFAALLNIIVSQQLSLSAAAAIWQRLEAVGEVTPDLVHGLGPDCLRRIGFSRPKIRYTLAIADMVRDRRFDLEELTTLDDAAAITRLTALPGIGRWSSEIYLMFCLGRPDIWPAADLALQEAVRTVKHLESRPNPALMDEIATAWKPCRSAAALLLWRYYRVVVRGEPTEESEGFR